MSILATVFVALLPLATKGPDPADVKPGWLGFIMFLLLAVATALLCLSFRKQLKKIRFDDGSGRQTDQVEPREQDEPGDPHPHRA